MSFGGPFGYGGMMPPAQSGGLDHYDPNDYKYRPPYRDNVKTPLDIYEKKEDLKTLGTIVSTALAGAAALIFIRHVQTLRAGEGFINSMFSPNSRNGLKEASRNLHRDIKTSHQKQKWVQEIDEHAAYIKQMNSVKNKTPEQKLQRQKSIDALKTLIYGKDTGLGIDRNDPLLKWDPPTGWGRVLPFGSNGFNWTLGRVSEGSMLHRYSQPGEVRTIVKAHKLLESRQVDKIQKKASKDTSSFGSSDTFADDVLSSASSSGSTLRAPSLIPELTKDLGNDAKIAVLHHHVTLKDARLDSIEGHFEARHALSKRDKGELLKEIKKRKKTFKEDLKPYTNEKKHIDSISALMQAGDETDRITNLARIKEEASKRLKSLNKNKAVNNAHISFYKDIEKLATITPGQDNGKILNALKERIGTLEAKEGIVNEHITLSRSLLNTMKNEDK